VTLIDIEIMVPFPDTEPLLAVVEKFLQSI
jgi:hypothetical protein